MCGPACSEMHRDDLSCEFWPERRSLRENFRVMFESLGLQARSEALEDTPDRWISAMAEFTAGYREDPEKILGRTFEVAHSGDPIAVSGVTFTSVCEHHLLPFTGTAMIAYKPYPDGRVVGLSKLPRLLDVYARRFQTQEQITKQVTDALDQYLSPRGSACVIKSEHGCLAHRGARKPGAVMVTTSFTGYFQDQDNRRELLATVGGPATGFTGAW